MASSPPWKVYRNREYIGCTKHAEDAAALVSLTETGVVRYDHGRIVWREGKEEFSAGESYDRAAGLMHQRKAPA